MEWIRILPITLPEKKVLAESRYGHTLVGKLYFHLEFPGLMIYGEQRPEDIICIADDGFNCMSNVYRYQLLPDETV